MDNGTNKSDFERLYAMYYAKLVRFSKEYVLSVETAENIVQDVFVAVWERRGELDTIQNKNAWLFRLTRNKCIDFLRHAVRTDANRQSLNEATLKELEFKLFALNQFDADALADEEIEKLIADALEKLPPQCRVIFTMNRFENLTYQQIADTLKLSPNTVSNQISIAIKKLKVQLKDYLPLLMFVVV